MLLLHGRNDYFQVKKIVFITPQDVQYGFSLSGVTHYIAREEELEGMLIRVLSEIETGIIIIDERLIKGIMEERLREIEYGWQGIVLVLPSPERPRVEVEDYAARLIRRAIGYHVRLRL